MTQQQQPPVMELVLSHKQVQVGGYVLGWWEAVRGLPLELVFTATVGPNTLPLPNLLLSIRTSYYGHTATPFLGSPNPVLVPVNQVVTRLKPAGLSHTVVPPVPGIMAVHVSAQMHGTNVQLLKDGQATNEISRFFYVVDRELALLVAHSLKGA